MRVLVVGCGLAGISSAYFLSREGHDVVLIERTSHFGGQLRTLSYKCDNQKTYFFDLGPHIPSNDGVWNDLCKNVESITVRTPMKLSIKLPKFDLIYPMGLDQFGLTQIDFLLRHATSFLWSAIHKRKEAYLEDVLINLYGKSLYIDYLKNYISNFWKASPKFISKDFRLRVKPPKMQDIAKSLFLSITNKVRPTDKRIYPRYGIGDALYLLIEEINKKGVEIKMKSVVKNIIHSDDGMHVEVEDSKGQHKYQFKDSLAIFRRIVIESLS